MTNLQLIRLFAKEVIGSNITISRRRIKDNWNINVMGNIPYLYLPSNLNYEGDEMDAAFRDNFIMMYHPAQGLSDVTLSLLHELGHWMTRFDYDEEEDLRARDAASTPAEYLALECEALATAWAIKWLSNHYDRAKQFDSELTFA